MGDIRTSANASVRDYATDGVPASGVHDPVKSEIRATFGVVEDEIESVRALAATAATGVGFITQVIRVRSTGNVAIATALENGDTLNGVTLATGDHVFLGSQTAPAENGLYTVPASGAASRASFADSAAELARIAFLVSEGTVGAGERYTLPLDADAITVGTTALAFARIGVEVDVSGEVATSRGTFSTLGERVDDIDARVDATVRTEAALARAALYGITDPVEARLFAEESLEADFAGEHFRSGFAPLYADATELPGWTFARASAGTVVPEGGSVVSFASGEPRISNRGLRSEAACTEMLGYTTQLTSWTLTNCTVTASGVDYANATAYRVEATTTAATNFTRSGTGSLLSTGNTFQCVVKKGSGATEANTFTIWNLSTSTTVLRVTLNYDTGEIDPLVGSAADCKATPMGGGWWLLEMTPPSGFSTGNAFRCHAGFIGLGETAGEYFLISHAQCVTLPVATSRIINNTGTSASRAADDTKITYAPSGDFTLFAEVSLGDHSIEETLFSLAGATSNERLTVYRSTTGALTLLSKKNGTETRASVAAKDGARTLKVAIASFGDQARMSVDGGEVVAVGVNRPTGLTNFWLGLASDTLDKPLNGDIRRIMGLTRAATDAELRAMTRSDDVAALSSAPLIGNPLQGRFNPATGSTPDGDYGTVPVVVYGELPCDLLIGEMRGASAIGIGKDGNIRFRDLAHLGRCADVDPITGYSIVGAAGYRTLRWLDRNGHQKRSWSVPGGYTGEIYGIRTNGVKFVVNMFTTGSPSTGKTLIWDVDSDGVPTGSEVDFTGYTGNNATARGLLYDTSANLLWVASTGGPVNGQGCQGELQAYDLTSGALVHNEFAHYPNDVDMMPNGEIVWADEHLDRIRAYNPATGAVRTLMAGLQVRAEYELGTSISANVLATRTFDGSNLSACAVEYRGLEGLYAPNGVTAISNDLFAIADTDNGRVIIARAIEGTWVPEIVAVVALLNEPTKVRIIPPAA